MIEDALNNGHKPLIAVVDDNASFLRSVGRLLSSAGYSVATFASARGFLETLSHTTPRCLVLDVHMPEMSGLELREQLVTQGICPPTVLMTAYDTPQTREHAGRPDTFGLLLKPFDKQELLNAVNSALRASNTKLG